MSESGALSFKAATTPLGAALVVLGYVKYLFSTLLSLSAIAFVCYGVANRHAVLEGPPWAHYLVLVFVLVLLAYLEGLQVAILALENQSSDEWKEQYPRAFRLHRLATRGKNVQRFLVGRQFYVVFVVFLCSQVTTFPTITRPDFFPHVLWFILVETALPGALIVLAFGQLMPQLIASRHPVVFCNLPGAMLVLWITLFLEAIGVTHFSWLLTNLVSCVCRLGPEGSTPGSAVAVRSESFSASAADEEAPAPADDATSSASGHSQHSSLLKRMACIQGEFRASAPLKPEQIELLSGSAGGQAPAPVELFIDASAAKAGLEPSSQKDKARAASHEGKTPQAHLYPPPRDVVEHLIAIGQEVPRFLLPPDHPLHVPPHVVAYSLMAGGSN